MNCFLDSSRIFPVGHFHTLQPLGQLFLTWCEPCNTAALVRAWWTAVILNLLLVSCSKSPVSIATCPYPLIDSLRWSNASSSNYFKKRRNVWVKYTRAYINYFILPTCLKTWIWYMKYCSLPIFEFLSSFLFLFFCETLNALFLPESSCVLIFTNTQGTSSLFPSFYQVFCGLVCLFICLGC